MVAALGNPPRLHQDLSWRRGLHHVLDEQPGGAHRVHIPAQRSVGELEVDPGRDLIDGDIVSQVRADPPIAFA